MRKSIIWIISLCCVGISFAGEYKLFSSEVKMPFKVIDDTGSPVTHANVRGYFWDPHKRDACGDTYKGRTDTNGVLKVSGKGYAYIEGMVTKMGYYNTTYKISLGNKNLAKKNGTWPLKETKVILREKKTPIPMYAKRVETYIPATNIACGYDLMIGDWVKPYGKGKQKDLSFNITQKNVKNRMDFEGKLEITFSEEKDGFCKYKRKGIGKSVYDWDYTAPTNGYTYPLYITVGYKLPKGYYKKSDVAKGYFRIRSITNHYGELVSAYYGKCTDKIDFDVRETKTGFLRFQYYFNPTPNDRNMEFDPKHNLLKVLSREEVREP